MPTPNVEPVGNPFRFLWHLGYRRLCPIIPPDAELSPRSLLRKRLERGEDARGKAPGLRRPDGWSGFDWTAHESTELDCDTWHAMGAGVGIKLGRGLVAVDIDTIHKETSLALYHLAQEMLGADAPVRFGRKPKALLLYRVSDAAPYDKVVFSTPSEDRALVEVLTEGRQFVALGQHPGTRRDYEWHGGPKSLDLLPEVTPAQLQAYLDEVQARMPASRRFAGSSADRSEIDQKALIGDPKLVAAAVNALPNRNADFPTRDDWLRIGYALKAAMGPGREDEALDLWQQWSGRWDGGTVDPEEAEAEWQRMRPPYAIGASYVYERATSLGGWTGLAEHFFGPPQDPPQQRDKSTFELLRIRDILELPDPHFLIDRHIPEASLGFLYGRPGCGKSFVALDWAMHLACSLPHWHGASIRSRPGARVLYLAREGSTGFKARISAWQRSNPLLECEPQFALIRQTINFMAPSDIGKLVATVRAAQLDPLDLIVVDTVSRVLPGADENLQREMTLFIHACDALMEATKAAVLGVHHAGKSGDMRGSTVLSGAGDFVFSLSRDPEAKIGRLACIKQKDAPDGWSEAYAFEAAHGSLIVRKVEEVGAAATERQQDMSPDRARAVLEALREAWETGEPWSPYQAAKHRYAPRAVASAFGIRAEDAERMLAAWCSAGVVDVARCGRKKGYRLLVAPAERQEPAGLYD